jgi:ketosteroid isomerase-like protein
MRSVLAGALVLLSFGTAVAQQPAAGKAGVSVAETLLKMENQWAQASKTGNADGLAPLLSADFVALDSDGTLRNKTDVLARVKKGKWTTNEISDMKVTVHGDTAIVTGAWVGTLVGVPSHLPEIKAVRAARKRRPAPFLSPNGRTFCALSR